MKLKQMYDNFLPKILNGFYPVATLFYGISALLIAFAIIIRISALNDYTSVQTIYWINQIHNQIDIPIVPHSKEKEG